MGFTLRNLLLVAVGVACFFSGVRLPDQAGSAVLFIGVGVFLVGFYRLANGDWGFMAILMTAAFIAVFVLLPMPQYFGAWSPIAVTAERLGDGNLVPSGEVIALLVCLMTAVYFLPQFLGKKKKH